jgi:PAS domain S-box-containing protein
MNVRRNYSKTKYHPKLTDKFSGLTSDASSQPPSEFYRALVEDMPVMVCRASADGTLTYVNQQFCEFYGTKAEELIGMDFFSFFPDEEQNILRNHYAGFTPENPVRSFEIPMQHSDGKIHWQRWVERIIYDNVGRSIGFQSVGEDITRQKEIEEQLRSSEEKFKAAVDNVAEGFALLDEICNDDGEVVDFQVEFINAYGFQFVPKNFLGRKASEILSLYTPDNNFLKDLVQTSRTGKPLIVDRFDINNIGVQPPGLNSIEIRVSSFMDKLVFVWRTITERVKAEEDLKHSRDELAAIVETSNTLLSIHDINSLLLTIIEQIKSVLPFDNAAIYSVEDDEVREKVFYRWYRYPETASNGRRFIQEFVLPLFGGLAKSDSFIDIKDSLVPSEINQQLIKYFGADSQFIIQNRSILMLPLIVNNKITGVLIILHHDPNIYTDNLRHLVQAFANNVALAIDNAQLYQQAQTQAVMQERLRLARELHDSVTQSLYSINLYTDAARKALATGRVEKVTEYLEELHDLALIGTKELRLLIYELRPPELGELGLVGAIRSRLGSVERRSGLDAKLTVQGQGNLPVKVENELFQVTQEALNNIVKHSNATRVSVRIHYLLKTVRLSIRDNGVGFDLKRIETGVGLKTIRERVTLLDGKFNISSIEDKGTILTVEVGR